MEIGIKVTKIEGQYAIQFSKDDSVIRTSFYGDELGLALISASTCVNLLESCGIGYLYSNDIKEIEIQE